MPAIVRSRGLSADSGAGRSEGSVKPLTILATPDGKWVFPNSAEFFAALGDPDPDYDAIAFAVKNLGFVKFQVLEHSITEIDLHPRTVELPALLAVQQQILTSPTRLFLIKYFDSEWRSEISSGTAGSERSGFAA